MNRLKGEIRRVVFSNTESGFAVVEVAVEGRLLPVTVVGTLGELFEGQIIEVDGRWETHPKFGRRFKAVSFNRTLPESKEAIMKYLRSGLIEGIGPVLAERIVKEFGEDTLKVIDERPEELLRVEGIGRKRVEQIKGAWEGQREVSSLMVFLKEHDLTTGLATKIIKRYGNRAMAVITQNPYRLAWDIRGVGFKSADKIASKMGFNKECAERIEAGVVFKLDSIAERGHVFYPLSTLRKSCSQFLGVAEQGIDKAIASLASRQEIIIEDLNEAKDRTTAGNKAVFLKRYHSAETSVAFHIQRLIRSRQLGPEIDADKAIEWIKRKFNIPLASKQLEAIRRALMEKLLIITGGPGTGKTTIIKAIIQIFSAKKARIRLAAPTGRASQRMMEATSMEAGTIHRLLEFSWERGGFERNEDKPLEVDVLIIDEVSMIDISLMSNLLRAVPSGARVILVGDADQLPSVGPGNVLKDMISSEKIPVVALTEIFRQAKQSMITLNAHRINHGQMPQLTPTVTQDFYFIEQGSPESVLKTVLEVVCKRIPKRFSMDPLRDIQVLCPMHKGIVGTEELNRRLQELLNPRAKRHRIGRGYCAGDKVMQVRNDYEKEVFNGDIGFIKSVDNEAGKLIVHFEGRDVAYKFADLDDLIFAYATTVHKSQGSEYPAVVLPLVPQHYLLLQRNLVYTAVTRAKRLLVMVGSRKALAMAVANQRPARRLTLLSQRLKSL